MYLYKISVQKQTLKTFENIFIVLRKFRKQLIFSNHFYLELKLKKFICFLFFHFLFTILFDFSMIFKNTLNFKTFLNKFLNLINL
jgi:hypothetical protein